MKKLFALLLVAIMALSMVACGADKTATTEAPKTDAPAAPAATQAETTVSDEPVTIHCLHYMVEGNKSAGLEKIQAAFSEKYPTLPLKTAHTPRALTTLHSCRPRSLPAICPRS